MSRFTSIRVVAVLLFVAGGLAVRADTSAGARWRVGVVGDSLTWYAATYCGEQGAINASGFPVVNVSGKIGRTTLGGYAAWQPSWGANVAVLGLGTNDTRMWNDPGRWRSSIRTMLGRVGPTTKIVWVDVWRWDGPSWDPTRGQRLATQFDQILVQEIRKLGTRATIANWSAVASAHRDWTLSDGIHDTLSGCRNRIRVITTALHRLLDPPPPTTTTRPATSTTRPATTTTRPATTTTRPPTATSPSTTTVPTAPTSADERRHHHHRRRLGGSLAPHVSSSGEHAAFRAARSQGQPVA